MRRYIANRDELATAKRIRETFYDAPASKVIEVPWEWPRHMQEVGECDVDGGAVMYSSSKWQKNPRDLNDYKHVAESPWKLLVRPDFLDFRYSDERIRVVGPMRELNDMPRSFAVLAKILGLQFRLYEGTNDHPRMPADPRDGYYQIDIAATLGAQEHPETGETFLFVYDNSGVHAVIVGEMLGIEKDGIVG